VVGEGRRMSGMARPREERRSEIENMRNCIQKEEVFDGEIEVDGRFERKSFCVRRSESIEKWE
jgi:hypothetical protein